MSDADLLCHCFGHSRADVVRDVLANGRSTILETIREAIRDAKRSGGCDCALKNPRGR